ncbi:MAG: phosphoglycerate kinase [Candidatus Hodarchaeota archaeon]
MELKFKSIDDVDLKGKKVLLRVDMNSTVDLEKNELRDDPRIKAIAPTVKALKDTALVVMAHQSRPGKKDFIGLELHAKHLGQYVDQKVSYIDDIYGDKAKEAIKKLQVGEVLVLDNCRKFLPDNDKMSPEDAANTEMVKELSPLFDYFVNDAFGAAHRAQPSIIGWPKIIAGPLVAKELAALKKLIENPEKPMVMLVGGAKAVDKYKACRFNIENERVDKVLVAGLTAVLLYTAKGVDLGSENKKLIEKDLEKAGDAAKEFMEKHGDKVVLPVDFAIDKDGKREEIPLEEVGKLNIATGDIGSKTIELFKKELEKSKTCVANGPPGIFEKEIFQKATHELIDAMIASGGYSVIGGGEMGTAAEETGKSDKISFISTGGGAMLEFLSGKKLPLLEALARSA